MLSTVEDRDVVVPKTPIVCGVCLGEEAKGDLLHDVLRAGLERKFAYVRGTGRVVSINSLLFGPRFPDFSTRATHNEGLLCTCGSRSSLRLFNQDLCRLIT